MKQPGQPDGVSGLWNYRSLKNTDTFIYPNAPQTRHELILQEALLKLEATLQGGITTLQGTIEWLESMRPANLRLDLNGRVFQQQVRGVVEPANFTLEGTGRPGTDTAGWEYGYRGHLTPGWPNGVKQIPALVGEVIRYKSHGDAPAGYVAPFIAVKR